MMSRCGEIERWLQWRYPPMYDDVLLNDLEGEVMFGLEESEMCCVGSGICVLISNLSNFST